MNNIVVIGSTLRIKREDFFKALYLFFLNKKSNCVEIRESLIEPGTYEGTLLDLECMFRIPTRDGECYTAYEFEGFEFLEQPEHYKIQAIPREFTKDDKQRLLNMAECLEDGYLEIINNDSHPIRIVCENNKLFYKSDFIVE